jgi:hypothetical protein
MAIPDPAPVTMAVLPDTEKDVAILEDIRDLYELEVYMQIFFTVDHEAN